MAEGGVASKRFQIMMFEHLPIGTTLDKDGDLSALARRRLRTDATAISNMPEPEGSEIHSADRVVPAMEHEMEHGNFMSLPKEKEPRWQAPLAKAFGAIGDILRAGQSEDFLPPPEMQGVIPRPQLIPYQPIPYQAPILRRY
jgi:hypothetical protein